MAASAGKGGTVRNIVVPIDDSEDAERAADYALDNIYRDGDLVTFLHVIPSSQYVVVGTDAADTIVEEDEAAQQQQIEATKEFIDKRFLTKAKAMGFAYRVEVVRFMTDTDHLSEVICQRAEALNAIAVVMKKHDKGVIKEFLLGSATTRVAQHCKQPVVILH